ncbi:peroxisomal membrane protein pex14 [Chytriomyces hyalinus]|nr:peroxisomal membrane protein pex14 [Chytriomyces hyalinus]
MSSETIRPESVALAVKFLADPQVAAAPLAKRVAFLESKGLTAAEIDVALRQTATTASRPADTPPPLPTTPPPQMPAAYKPDWRDYVIGTIGLVGFGYGAFHLIQNYLLPSLSWPNFGQQKESQDRMEAQLAAMANALEVATKTIQDQSNKLKDVLDQSVLEQERSGEEVRGIREELEALKAILPSLSKSNPSDPSLADLQSDVKSLKNLLLNRKSFPPIPTQSTSMPLAYQSSSNGIKTSPKRNGDSSEDERKTDTAPAPILHDVDSFLGKFTAGKPAIPSWQLEPASKPVANGYGTKSASVNSSSNGGYSVNLGGGSDADEEKVDDGSSAEGM